MHRREFITFLGGAAAASSVAAHAQQQATPVIGYLDLGAPETSLHQVAAFRQGLNETGFVEGRNVTVDYRYGYNEVGSARREELAADLVRRRVALVVANSN